jgi:hypothetical protein
MTRRHRRFVALTIVALACAGCSDSVSGELEHERTEPGVRTSKDNSNVVEHDPAAYRKKPNPDTEGEDDANAFKK